MTGDAGVPPDAAVVALVLRVDDAAGPTWTGVGAPGEGPASPIVTADGVGASNVALLAVDPDYGIQISDAGADCRLQAYVNGYLAKG